MIPFQGAKLRHEPAENQLLSLEESLRDDWSNWWRAHSAMIINVTHLCLPIWRQLILHKRVCSALICTKEVM